MIDPSGGLIFFSGKFYCNVFFAVCKMGWNGVFFLDKFIASPFA